MTTEFWGLLPGGELPSAAHAQMQADVDAKVAGRVADMEAIRDATLAAAVITGVGRPDIPATLTTPGTATLVAAATSGTVFRSLDGPQGAWEWRKRGTTWTCEVGDTGWLDVAHRLAPGIAGATVSPRHHVKREGSRVTWSFRVMTGATFSGNGQPRTSVRPLTENIAQFPNIDYAPFGTCLVTNIPGTLLTGGLLGRIDVQGFTGTWGEGDLINGQASYLTTALWPTTLTI